MKKYTKNDSYEQSEEYENEKQEKKKLLVRSGFESNSKYGIPLVRKQNIDLNKIQPWGYVKTKQNDKENKHKTIHFFTYDWFFETFTKNPSLLWKSLTNTMRF